MRERKRSVVQNQRDRERENYSDKTTINRNKRKRKQNTRIIPLNFSAVMRIDRHNEDCSRIDFFCLDMSSPCTLVIVVVVVVNPFRIFSSNSET